MLYYIRSNVDGLVGFKYNSSMCFYVKNIQDDIIGILDSNYNVVAKYDYDSWGNIIKITNGNDVDVSNDMTHIANINPFRYRSYYYDKETELYYLNSRYYNPKWGRFINPDNYISTDSGPLGFNMYLYCNNDPINKKDPNGHAIVAGLVIGLAVVGALFLANTIYRTKKAKKDIKEVQKKKNIPDRTKDIDKTAKKFASDVESNKLHSPKIGDIIFFNAWKSP